MNAYYPLIEEGKNCLQENHLDKAEELLRKAVESYPENSSAHFELGKCLFILARYADAAASLETALRFAPAHLPARIMLAKSLKMTGDHALARERLEEARQADPANEDILRELKEVSEKLEKESAPCEVREAPCPPEKKIVPAIPLYERFPIETKGFLRSFPPYRACVTWFVNHKCNYHCSYCQSGFTEPEGFRVLSPSRWFEIWKDLYDRYGSMAIQATGGEPTLYPEFFKVFREISKMHNVELQTNLTWDPDELINSVPPQYVSRVGASFHQEFEQFDVFIKKMKKLKDAGYKVETTYVAYPPFLRKAKEFLSKAAEMNVSFLILSFQGEYQGKRYPESYNEEERDLLRQLNLDIGGHAPGRAEWDVKHKVVVDKIEEKEEFRRTCRMGQMYAWIQPDGRAMRCCKSPDKLGNLLDGTFRLQEDAQTCLVDRCICFRSMVLGEESRWHRQWPGAEDKGTGKKEEK